MEKKIFDLIPNWKNEDSIGVFAIFAMLMAVILAVPFISYINWNWSFTDLRLVLLAGILTFIFGFINAKIKGTK